MNEDDDFWAWNNRGTRVQAPTTAGESTKKTSLPVTTSKVLDGATLYVTPLNPDGTIKTDPLNAQERGFIDDVINNLERRHFLLENPSREYDSAGNWLNAQDCMVSQEAALMLRRTIDDIKADYPTYAPIKVDDAFVTLNLTDDDSVG